MTEDDTFNTLRRIPFTELVKLIKGLPDMFNVDVTDRLASEEVDWLYARGWSELDFKKTWRNHKFETEPDVTENIWWPAVQDHIRELENERRRQDI